MSRKFMGEAAFYTSYVMNITTVRDIAGKTPSKMLFCRMANVSRLGALGCSAQIHFLPARRSWNLARRFRPRIIPGFKNRLHRMLDIQEGRHVKTKHVICNETAFTSGSNHANDILHVAEPSKPVIEIDKELLQHVESSQTENIHVFEHGNRRDHNTLAVDDNNGGEKHAPRNTKRERMKPFTYTCTARNCAEADRPSIEEVLQFTDKNEKE